MLRSILAGAIWTGHRLGAANLGTAECRFCALGEVEDANHLWWRCPKWAAIRHSHYMAHLTQTPEWPACLACCGLMPENFDLSGTLVEACYEDSQDSEGESDVGDDPLLASDTMGQCWDGSVELMDRSRVVVFTDGACRNNQDPRFRRAGVGAFWAHGQQKKSC